MPVNKRDQKKKKIKRPIKASKEDKKKSIIDIFLAG